MNYWKLLGTNDSSAISADIKRNFSQQTLFADATDKDGEVEGDLKDDYPFFSGSPEEIFSQRLTDEVLKFNPEGIMTRPVALTLPDGSLNHSFCEVTVSAYVDCIDFRLSELDLDEDNGLIDFVDKLVLDVEKALLAGYDIFRLQHRFTSIIVSDRLKHAIEAINPIGVRFKPTDGSE